jgi:hypothetical protein
MARKTSAFEIVAEDIQNALSESGLDISIDLAEEHLEKFDHYKIQEAALYGDDIDQQIRYAYQEIKEQAKKLKLL